MKVSELNDEALVKAYIQLRDRRSKRKAAFDNDDATDKSHQEKIEVLLLKRFMENGIESVRTTAGTAYKSIRSSASVASWDDFFGFVQEHQAWSLLEHRASKTAVEEHKEVTGALPPGLNWREEVVINVRRS